MIKQQKNKKMLKTKESEKYKFISKTILSFLHTYKMLHLKNILSCFFQGTIIKYFVHSNLYANHVLFISFLPLTERKLVFHYFPHKMKL